MDGVQVKQEIIEQFRSREPSKKPSEPVSVIDLSSSSDSDSDDSSPSSSSDDDGNAPGSSSGKRPRVSSGVEGEFSRKKKKKKKLKASDGVLPVGFLDPLPLKNAALPPPSTECQLPPVWLQNANGSVNANSKLQSCKQFWKAGDYEGTTAGNWDSSTGGMDHVRVHPKFLHSNATSHKWVLGAFAELLDNSLDEVSSGATYVNLDMLKNKKDGSRMLLIEDNGGGMDPDKMRQCMSLGYSVKSKIADTIGQYGNGFKTSTMRLGADVIVFSRCCGQDGKRPTQSIGLLSYTFLRSTGKEDIVVPMLDYERGGQEWNRLTRLSAGDWHRNLETIIQWSPFANEEDLQRQFVEMKDQGTRIIIYNLWEDDQGLLELDFDTDPHDIQIRGVNRDEKNIQMAKQFPNSKHFLTYRHSLRSYASILYLRIPPSFRIILRGRDVEQHNVVNDMMMTQEVIYRPHHGTDGVLKDSNMVAVVTIGFVKDAKAHIDVQGFNVYHKNRLIKPFWRLWNAAGSGGRGVIGVLEANFVEPAHDKQGFERTTVLSRLETRLIQMQKTYWSNHCHKIGYAHIRSRNNVDDSESSPEHLPETLSYSKKVSGSSSKARLSKSDRLYAHSILKRGRKGFEVFSKIGGKSHGNGHAYNKGGDKIQTHEKSGKEPSSLQPPSSPSQHEASSDEIQIAMPDNQAKSFSQKVSPAAGTPLGRDCSPTARSTPSFGNAEADQDCESNGTPAPIILPLQAKGDDSLEQLREENRQLRERLKRKEGEEVLGDLLRDLQFERDRCKSIESKLEEAMRKIEELNKEQEGLIDIFSEERERRDTEEENLRKKLKDASNTIQELLDKVRLLENMKSPNCKSK